MSPYAPSLRAKAFVIPTNEHATSEKVNLFYLNDCCLNCFTPPPHRPPSRGGDFPHKNDGGWSLEIFEKHPKRCQNFV